LVVVKVDEETNIESPGLLAAAQNKENVILLSKGCLEFSHTMRQEVDRFKKKKTFVKRPQAYRISIYDDERTAANARACRGSIRAFMHYT